MLFGLILEFFFFNWCIEYIMYERIVESRSSTLQKENDEICFFTRRF